MSNLSRNQKIAAGAVVAVISYNIFREITPDKENKREPAKTANGQVLNRYGYPMLVGGTLALATGGLAAAALGGVALDLAFRRSTSGVA